MADGCLGSSPEPPPFEDGASLDSLSSWTPVSLSLVVWIVMRRDFLLAMCFALLIILGVPNLARFVALFDTVVLAAVVGVDGLSLVSLCGCFVVWSLVSTGVLSDGCIDFHSSCFMCPRNNRSMFSGSLFRIRSSRGRDLNNLSSKRISVLSIRCKSDATLDASSPTSAVPTVGEGSLMVGLLSA